MLDILMDFCIYVILLICVTENRLSEEIIVGKSRDLHEGVEPTQDGNIQ